MGSEVTTSEAVGERVRSFGHDDPVGEGGGRGQGAGTAACRRASITHASRIGGWRGGEGPEGRTVRGWGHRWGGEWVARERR